jgi:hypothetical protein
VVTRAAPAAPPAPAAAPRPVVAAPARPAPAPQPQAAEDDWSDVGAPRGAGLEAPRAAPARPAPKPAAPAPAAAKVTELAEFDFEPEPLGVAAPPAPPPPAPIELDMPAPELELAPLHEFVPERTATGHQPEAPAPAAAAPAVVQGGAGFTPGGATPADGGEALLRQALSGASREVIERVVWEVVPQLAETIIRENLDRLVKSR